MKSILNHWVGLALLLVLFSFFARPAQAVEGLWTEDARNVCPVGVNQNYNRPVSDGSGGAIVCWGDTRTGTFDLYVQRLDAQGNTLWAQDGVKVCGCGTNHYNPQLLSDGNHGAFIHWYDNCLTAQHVDGTGALLWPANKVLNTGGTTDEVVAVSDGQGGAYFVMVDWREGSHAEIYAQHMDSQGNTLWAAEGRPICAALYGQGDPDVVLDGQGGAFFAWFDDRGYGSGADIYAQHVDSLGNTLWAQNGIPVCAAAENQMQPSLTADGQGGFIVAWRDYRNSGTSGTDIYAQRVNASGTPLWTADGVSVCLATLDQKVPITVTDGNGGAIIFWDDGDIHAQRLDADGNELWTSGGLALTSDGSTQEYCQAFADGQGGAIVMWEDYRDTHWAPFTQHLDAQGNTLWPEGGARICRNTGFHQRYPSLAPDGQGGALYAWQDLRDGIWKTYAQRMTRPRPVLQDINSPASVGEVKHAVVTGLYLQDPAGSVTAAKLTRTAQADIDAMAVNVTGRGSLTCDFDLTSAALGDWFVVVRDGYSQESREVVTLSVVTPTFTPTFTVTPTITPTFTITPTSTPTPTVTPTTTSVRDFHGKPFLAFPNPARGQVHFILPADQSGEVEIELFNLVGERVAEVKGAVAFGNGITWDCRQCAPGIYIAQVSLQGKILGKSKVALIQ